MWYEGPSATHCDTLYLLGAACTAEALRDELGRAGRQRRGVEESAMRQQWVVRTDETHLMWRPLTEDYRFEQGETPSTTEAASKPRASCFAFPAPIGHRQQ